jgi:hypothetical protein
VPGDTRRVWSGADPNTINGTDDVQDTADVTAAAQATAIANAMGAWEGQKCSQPGLNGGTVGFDTGAIFPLNPVPRPIAADVMHSGFRPGALFLAAFGPAGANILGVTFTFIFDDGGVPTDIDNDGYFDTAFTDIYYNDGFSWQTTGGTSTSRRWRCMSPDTASARRISARRLSITARASCTSRRAR